MSMDMVMGLAFPGVVLREVEAGRLLLVVISRNCTEREGVGNSEKEQKASRAGCCFGQRLTRSGLTGYAQPRRYSPAKLKVAPDASYCEVALPVPLDRTFTYAVREFEHPLRGARVIAPFRNEKLIGVVTASGVSAPTDFEAKYLEAVLDDEPLLGENLLALAEWIAGYYLAPLGEVLRTMLPLMAEVRRTRLLPNHRSWPGRAGVQRGWRWGHTAIALIGKKRR